MTPVKMVSKSKAPERLFWSLLAEILWKALSSLFTWLLAQASVASLAQSKCSCEHPPTSFVSVFWKAKEGLGVSTAFSGNMLLHPTERFRTQGHAFLFVSPPLERFLSDFEVNKAGPDPILNSQWTGQSEFQILWTGQSHTRLWDFGKKISQLVGLGHRSTWGAPVR